MSSLTRRETERYWTAETPRSTPRIYSRAIGAAHDDHQSTDRPSPEGARSHSDPHRSWCQKTDVSGLGFLKGKCPAGLLSDSGLTGTPEPSASENWSVRTDRKVYCDNCALILAALKRQALSMSLPNTLLCKDSSLSAFLHAHLQAPGGALGPGDGCRVCGARLSQLRRQVVHHILAAERGKRGGLSATEPPPGSAPTSSNSSSAPPGPRLSTRTHSPRSRRSARAPKTPNPEMDRWVEEQQQLAVTMPLSMPSSDGGGGVPIFPYQSTEDFMNGQRETASSQSGTKTSHISRVTSTVASCAAMSFLVRVAQKLNLSSRKKSPSLCPSPACPLPRSLTCFRGLIQTSPPPVPACLLQAAASGRVKDSPTASKVKVVLRVCPSQLTDPAQPPIVRVDLSRRRVTVMEPATQCLAQMQALFNGATVLPKTYTLDAAYTQESAQVELCGGILPDIIRSVVNGADGCVLSLGHDGQGRSYTMLGSDESRERLGVIPCAIAWLYRHLEQRKERARAGASLAVSVSAIEVCEEDETLRDLLSASGNIQNSLSTDIHLYQDPIHGMQLRNQRVIGSPSAVHAAALLDAAVASRHRGAGETRANVTSYMFFNLHLRQGQAGDSSRGKVSGMYSRLTLIDLSGGVKRSGSARDSRAAPPSSELGNRLLALLSGNKHVPSRDSRLTMLLQDALGNVTCHTTVVAHISESPTHLLETLSTLQTAARIRRTQKKAKQSTSYSPNGRSLSRERRGLSLRAFHSTSAVDTDAPILRLRGDLDDRSSSDQSCDTVIHMNPDGSARPGPDKTQGRREFVPIIPSLYRGKTDVEDPELASLLQDLLNFTRPGGGGEKKKKKEQQEVSQQEVIQPQRGGEAGQPERDCLKCDTFAELQERLGCIDGSEMDASKDASVKEPSADVAPEPRSDPNRTETASEKTFSSPRVDVEAGRGDVRTGVSVGEKVAEVGFPGDCFQREDSGLYDCEEGSAASSSEDQANPSHPSYPSLCQNRPPVSSPPSQLCEAYTPASAAVPSSFPLALEPTESRGSYEGADWSEPEARTSPAGKSSPMSPTASSTTNTTTTTTTSLHTSVLLGEILPRLPSEHLGEMKATITVTVQQPLDASGQDELVYTMVEEVTLSGGLERGGRGASIIRIRDAQSSARTEGSSGSRPIRIISNVSDDVGGAGPAAKAAGAEPAVQEVAAGGGGGAQCRAERALPSFINPMLLDPGREEDGGGDRPGRRGKPSVSFAGVEPVSGPQRRCPEPKGCREERSAGVSVAAAAPGSARGHRKRSGSRGASPPGRTAVESAYETLEWEDAVFHYGTSEAARKRHAPDRSRSGGRGPARSPGVPRRLGDSCCDIAARSPSGTRSPGYQVAMPTALQTASLPRGWHNVSRHATEDLREPRRMTSSSLCSSPRMSLERHASGPRQGLLHRAQESLARPSAGRKPRQRSSSSSANVASGSPVDPNLPSRRVRRDDSSGAGRERSPAGESGALFSAKLEQLASRADWLGGAPAEFDTRDGGSGSGSGASVSSKGSSKGEESSLTRASGSPRRTASASAAGSASSTPAQSPRPGRSRLSDVGKLMMSGPKVRRVSAPSAKTLSSSSPRALRQSDDRGAGLSPDAATPDRTRPSSPWSTQTLSRTQSQMPHYRVANGRISELLHRGGDPASGGRDLDKMAASASRSPGEERLVLPAHPQHCPPAHPVPSPYTRVTAPRRPDHLSGHASDATSVLSGELPPAMGRTALLCNRGSVVSSGYESLVRDSEATGSGASHRDSLGSDRSRPPPSASGRSGRIARRRSNASSHQRRLSHDTSLSLRRSTGGPRGAQRGEQGVAEAYEIRVYEIDAAEKLQRRGPPGKQGTACFSAKLKFLEHRQGRITEVRAKYSSLHREMELAKLNLMLEPGKWNQEFDMWQTFEVDSLEHLEALELVTARLESRLNRCKASVMMVTCFDAASRRRQRKRRRRALPDQPVFLGI